MNKIISINDTGDRRSIPVSSESNSNGIIKGGDSVFTVG